MTPEQEARDALARAREYEARAYVRMLELELVRALAREARRDAVEIRREFDFLKEGRCVSASRH